MIVLILFFCMICAWISYTLYGHQLVKGIYEHNSIKILNRVIQQNTEYPAEYYYVMADEIFYGYFAAFLLFTIFFLALKLFFTWEAADICIVSLSLTILLLSCSGIIIQILCSPWSNWDASRLAWTFSIRYGYSLYPLIGEGPMLSESYGPLAALVYLPLIFINASPTLVVILASLISVCFYFLPLLWICLLSSRKFLFALCIFAWFCLFTFNSRSLNSSAFSVHADAPALGFSALACAILYNRKLRNVTLLFSAIFSICAVWTKQSLMPILFALPLWIFLSNNHKYAKRYIIYIILFGILTLIFFSCIFAFQNLRFYMFTYPDRCPWQYGANPAIALLKASFNLLKDCFLLIIIASLLIILSLYRSRSYNNSAKNILKNWICDNQWLMFLVISVLMVPTSLLGNVKAGGAENTLSPAVYFIAAACALGLMKYIAFSLYPHNALTNKISILSFILLLISLIFISIPTFRDKLPALLNLGNNYQEVAYKYAKKYPAEVYFPEAPLASLLAEGKLYHFQFGISDRELIGFPVSREHFRAYIPSNIRLVAFSRNYQSQYIMKYLPEFSKRVTIEELPDWIIYARK